MPITPLPTPPTRSDPASFAARGDAFLAALPTFQIEANALETNVNAKEISAVASAGTATTKAAEAAASAVDATNNGAAQVVLAAEQVVLATWQANAAAASAVTAFTAPGTSATSATSLSVAAGSKSLTIETGKSIVVGMSVKIASTASPTSWVFGDVTAYDSGTGALTVNATLTQGSGTYAAWTISLSAPASASGDWKIKTFADSFYTAVNGDKLLVDTSGGPVTINLPATPSAGWAVEIKDGGASWGTNNMTLGRNGSTIENLAEDYICATNRDHFVAAFNGTTWRP